MARTIRARWPKLSGLLSVAITLALLLYGRKLSANGSLKSLLNQLFISSTQAADRKFKWHNLPLPLGLVVLIGNRMLLRERNLHDTSAVASIPEPPAAEARGLLPAGEDTTSGRADGPSSLEEASGRHLTARTADGSYNDLEQPEMGRARTRFGRNVPLEQTYPEPEAAILTPNPRLVSRELMTRETFQPATTLNLLAASWIQFMVRDWLSHGPGDIERAWRLPLGEDDPWGGAGHERPMRIPRTLRDPTRPPGPDRDAPTWLNTETHWWDGSQLYGSSRAAQARVRSGRDGKLSLGPDGAMPGELLAELSRQAGWWIGLAMLQTLFAREHNAICDRLRAEYPAWGDDDLFDRARLVNTALLAKIHTVEWTPAIISHPTTQYALRANWWGIEMERLHRIFGRIGDSEVISGIPGSPTDHHSAPYTITEEFIAVYRMHPLIPDRLSFRAAADDASIEERPFPEVTDRYVQEILARVAMGDLFYSFGTDHPGAITLHNYPPGLQEFRRPDGTFVDLAATDILRIRELGVPRYNAFRRLLQLPPAESFEALTDNPTWAAELRRVYDDDLERVDLMVGLFAEPRPPGFGFSDTAFRIFILMASRRLKSDRFFTVDYRPAVYTQAGLDWVADNSMLSVLRRHCPTLIPTLGRVENAFHPWPRAAA